MTAVDIPRFLLLRLLFPSTRLALYRKHRKATIRYEEEEREKRGFAWSRVTKFLLVCGEVRRGVAVLIYLSILNLGMFKQKLDVLLTDFVEEEK